MPRARRFTPLALAAAALALLSGCATDPATGKVRAPSDSIRGILAEQPPLDTTGLTDEQIAKAQRARFLEATLESKQRRDRRRRMFLGRSH
ncbi:MAG: hypothetical protein AAGE65_04575 [Planctomycetota bacterium]